MVMPWAFVSKDVNGVKDIDFAQNKGGLENTDSGELFSDTLLDDRIHSVPTQSKARVFGIWNSEHEKNPDSAVSVAISGVVNVALETKFTDPTIGLRVGVSRDRGIPEPYVALPPDVECVGTIIGSSKPVSNSDMYLKIGYKQPVMSQMLLHVRDAPPNPKPSETVKGFAKNVVSMVGMSTASNEDTFGRRIMRPHLSISQAESEITTPRPLGAAYQEYAKNIVDAILKGKFVEIKEPAEQLLDSYVFMRDSELDEFPWDKLCRLPFGWETQEINDASEFQDGDYVCMGLIALRVWLTRDPVL